MKEIIYSAVLIAFTAALIGIIRIITGRMGKECGKPEGYLRLYYDDGCGCLEYILWKILRSDILRHADIRIEVCDRVNTEDSRKWLMELQKKLGYGFDIETEVGGNTGEERHNTRDG